MTKGAGCIVCREQGQTTLGVRFVKGQGPYCESHAMAWEEYLR